MVLAFIVISTITSVLLLLGVKFDGTVTLGNVLTIVAAVAGIYTAFLRQGDKIDKITEWIEIHQKMADKRDELGHDLEVATIKLVTAIEYLSKRVDNIDTVVIGERRERKRG